MQSFRKCFILAVVIFSCTVFKPAKAVEGGMFLCPSPVAANSFWLSLLQARQTGAQVDHTVATQISVKNGCAFVVSTNLKPVDFVNGEMSISDTQVSGWADPHLYIMYVNGN